MESLKQAVFNGADEVYLGVKNFNARNIEGFNLETLKQAVDFAHLHNVRVFLTVNILFKDEEINSALDLIVDANNIGVDAFIIQDIGLASLVHKHYPSVEMHASTQMGIHNLEGVKFIEKFGFKRVCLSRETPLSEIERIHKNSKIEIEYFVQGALCVAFSGNCYMSSYLFDASGNRGRCKQLCRLPYDFKFNGKTLKSGYLLSAKDFNMLNRLKDLEKAGVVSLKIEGRARRPFYVGTATRIYRQALDGEKYNLKELELGFNRGYTEGYFKGNKNIISNIQNHIGVEIGKVSKFNVGKKFNEIYISSNQEITPKSTLKFFRTGKEIATISAYDVKKVGDLFKITSTSKVQVADSVNLIADQVKEDILLKTTKKVKIFAKITAKCGEKIKFSSNNFNFEVEGEICEQAKNSPITKQDFISTFKKNDYFDFELDFDLGNVFIIKSSLNEFRRNVVAQLFDELTKVKNKTLTKVELKINKQTKELTNYEILNGIEKSNKKIAIYNPSEYNVENVKSFVETNKGKNCFLNLPIFALESDVEKLKEIVEKTKIGIVANNYYAMTFDCEKIVGGGLNVFNSFAHAVYNLPYIKAEGGEFKMPYMTLRHCPMKEHLNANCDKCPYKEGYTYQLINEFSNKKTKGKEFLLRRIKMSTCTFELVDKNK